MFDELYEVWNLRERFLMIKVENYSMKTSEK